MASQHIGQAVNATSPRAGSALGGPSHLARLEQNDLLHAVKLAQSRANVALGRPSLKKWHLWHSARGLVNADGQREIVSVAKIRICETVPVSGDP
jgi:hypothetical protein